MSLLFTLFLVRKPIFLNKKKFGSFFLERYLLLNTHQAPSNFIFIIFKYAFHILYDTVEIERKRQVRVEVFFFFFFKSKNTILVIHLGNG